MKHQHQIWSIPSVFPSIRCSCFPQLSAPPPTLGPCSQYGNFCFFIASKSVNRKPYLVRTIFFTPTQILSTVTKRQRCRREYFFARRQIPFILHSYPSKGHLNSQIWRIKVALINVSDYTDNFACLRGEQGYNLPTPNSVFRRNANRALLHCSLMTSI